MLGEASPLIQISQLQFIIAISNLLSCENTLGHMAAKDIVLLLNPSSFVVLRIHVEIDTE